MPIISSLPIRRISQEEFAAIDYRVMRLAFDSHNALGRLYDEEIYQNDLAARIQAAGLGPVHTETPLTVTHRDFSKTYRLDIVIQETAIYELKTGASLLGEHDAQLLNYLLLAGVQHGKLVNFRQSKTESRFVNTTLTAEDRHAVEWDTTRWSPLGSECERLRAHLIELLEDWGTCLELPLYNEALIHLLGGEAKVLQMMPMTRDGLTLGNQRVCLLAPDTAFRLTAMAEGTESYQRHLVAFLHYSPLRAIHWINLARCQVQLVTLKR